jgi:hypothetical protein
MAEMNKIKGLVVGQYGEAISLTVVDRNGNPVDVSTYTGIQVILRDPFSIKTLTYTGTFVLDGTDGKIRFTPAEGDIDRDGDWEGQIVFTKSSVNTPTRVFTVSVEKRLGT